MWAVFLVATNQSRVHAVTVHCIHSMTRTLPKQPHVYPARAMPRHHDFARCIDHPLMMSRNVHFSSMQGWEVAITKPSCSSWAGLVSLAVICQLGCNLSARLHATSIYLNGPAAVGLPIELPFAILLQGHSRGSFALCKALLFH